MTVAQNETVEPASKRQKSAATPAQASGVNHSLREEEYAVCPPQYAENISAVLFSEARIQRRVRELSAEISKDFNGEPVVVVGLRTESFMALADVARHLTVPNTVDSIAVSSYGAGTTSSGSVVLKKDLSTDPAGKNIVIIEDLIDTGGTLAWIKKYFQSKGPKCVKICCILDKKARRTADVEIDYVGFDCPDEFVVGYGLDFAEDYRTLPFVGILKAEKAAELSKPTRAMQAKGFGKGGAPAWTPQGIKRLGEVPPMAGVIKAARPQGAAAIAMASGKQVLDFLPLVDPHVIKGQTNLDLIGTSVGFLTPCGRSKAQVLSDLFNEGKMGIEVKTWNGSCVSELYLPDASDVPNLSEFQLTCSSTWDVTVHYNGSATRTVSSGEYLILAVVEGAWITEEEYDPSPYPTGAPSVVENKAAKEQKDAEAKAAETKAAEKAAETKAAETKAAEKAEKKAAEKVAETKAAEKKAAEKAAETKAAEKKAAEKKAAEKAAETKAAETKAAEKAEKKAAGCISATSSSASLNKTGKQFGWRIRAQTTSSAWAWDVKKLVFATDSGRPLQLQDCAVVHSGCVSDRKHGGTDGYQAENAFRDGDAWWGGRQCKDGTFYIGLTCARYENVISLQLAQGDRHYASKISIEHFENGNDWQVVHTTNLQNLGTWNEQTVVWCAAEKVAETKAAVDLGDWKEFDDVDAFQGQNAETWRYCSQENQVLPDFNQAKRHCVRMNFGGFATHRGHVYFRAQSPGDLGASMKKSMGSNLYLKPEDLAAAGHVLL